MTKLLGTLNVILGHCLQIELLNDISRFFRVFYMKMSTISYPNVCKLATLQVLCVSEGKQFRLANYPHFIWKPLIDRNMFQCLN